jgi:SAM-dependent methyltransferase
MKLAAVFMVLLTSCLLTESIGIHALFGAFLASVFMPEKGAFKLHHRRSRPSGGARRSDRRRSPRGRLGARAWLAREREIANVAFQAATVYQLPYADGSFEAAFACAVLQHLAAPLAALRELRRVLKPGGVIGVADGSSTITFPYPTNALLQAWDKFA